MEPALEPNPEETYRMAEVIYPDWLPPLEEEPEPGRRLLSREDFLYQCEDLSDCVQIEHFGELLDVLCIAGSRGERLHREEMFG